MIPVLPFTAEVLDSLTGRYIAALWPLPMVAPALAILAVGVMLRPVRGGGRIAAGLLCAAWAGVGIDFHIKTMSTIDFLAPVYGGFFLLQAGLLAWTGIVAGRLAPGFDGDLTRRVGLALSVFAIVGYPVMALAAGRSWPSLPLAGLTPDPTVMLTLGVLLLAAAPARLHLLAIPVLWALVAGLTALSLDTPGRLVLPASAVVAVILALRQRPPA